LNGIRGKIPLRIINENKNTNTDQEKSAFHALWLKNDAASLTPTSVTLPPTSATL
jgi:hypothetical protein